MSTHWLNKIQMVPSRCRNQGFGIGTFGKSVLAAVLLAVNVVPTFAQSVSQTPVSLRGGLSSDGQPGLVQPAPAGVFINQSGDDTNQSPTDPKDSVPNQIAPQLDLEQQASELTRGGSETQRFELPGLSLPDTRVANIGTKAMPKDIAAGRLPETIALPTGETRRLAVALNRHTKQWLPVAICHQPLYFEDVMLERHGHEAYPCLQPIVSGVRFFGSIPLLPYMMTLHEPCENLYNLGYYRPGSAAPCLRQRLPYNRRAIRNQVLATGSAAVAFPM